MNEEGIRVRGLIKCYGGRRVVDGLTLSVKRGTVFGLLGANGAGKSTTIECILGTKKADAGEIRLLGQDPARDRKALFQRVGVQFQEGDYAQEIRVCELCEETASLYRMGNQGGKAILGLSRPFQFWEKKGPKMNECGQTLLGIGHLVHPSSGAAGNGQGRASAHSFQP